MLTVHHPDGILDKVPEAERQGYHHAGLSSAELQHYARTCGLRGLAAGG